MSFYEILLVVTGIMIGITAMSVANLFLVRELEVRLDRIIRDAAQS
jgi:hypothetical protein